MKRPCYILAVLACSSWAGAQPAAIEVPGVFGECNPVYASAADELNLFRRPDLESEHVVIPYRAGWRIEAPKRDGLTRVLSIGSLRVTNPDERMVCRVGPQQGPATLVTGELVDYLYYQGEGFGEIRFRGAECSAEVEESLGHFELLTMPDVQIWLRVFYADGTSPGWLLHDGSQTRVAGIEC